MASHSAQATIERIESVLPGPLAELGLDLEAVELTPAGKRRVLRIALDADGGLSLDDVAAATKAIDRVLEATGPDGAADVLGQQPYTLEVTSRGVDRPLTLPRHWRRNAGRLVKVAVTGADGERTELVGRILASTDDAATLDVAGSEVEVAYPAVAKALVQIEFNRKAPDLDGAGADGTPGDADTETDDSKDAN